MSACFGMERQNKLPKNVIKKIEKCCEAYPLWFFSADELEEATNSYSLSNRILSSTLFDIYRGVWKVRTYFIKKYKMSFCEPEMVYNDIFIGLKMEDHKNVLKFFGCSIERNPVSVYFSIERDPSSVYESGSIATSLDYYYRRMPSITRLKVGMDIANIMAHAHAKYIILQYIPMSTIILDSENIPKLTDFSTAVPIPEGCSYVQAKHLGIREYQTLASPEQLNHGIIDKKTDIYQLGRIFVKLLLQQNIDVPRNFPLELDVELRTLLGFASSNVDEAILEEFKKHDHLKEFAKLGFSCVRKNKADRLKLDVVRERLRQIINAMS